MARQRQRKQRQPVAPAPIELLPVELQLTIMEYVSSLQDLANLTDASRSFHFTYLGFQKTILANVTQATLGEAFVEACMLQYWQRYVDTGYRDNTETEDDGSETNDMVDEDGWPSGLYPDNTETENDGSETNDTVHEDHWPWGPYPDNTEDEDDGSETNDMVDEDHWPLGPYRDIQLKFFHDFDQLAMADTVDQIKHMRRLFTLEDFTEILTFEHDVVKPLSDLFARPKEVSPQEIIHRLGQWDPDFTPEPGTVTPSERQRINRTLYRFQLCCKIYGPKADQRDHIIDLGHSHNQAMRSDFFGRFDALENEELDFVYSGLAFQLQKAFILIRHQEQWSNMLRYRYGGPRGFHWGFQNWRLHGPIGLGGMVAGAASRGLELVQKVREAQQAGQDEVARVMLESDPPELDNFLWDALSRMRESYHFREEFPESWSDEFWR